LSSSIIHDGREYELFDKTELRVTGIRLDRANLDDVAASVAHVFGIPPSDVYVIDAREDRLALDIRRDTIDPRSVVGKRDALLAALAATPGVSIGPDSTVTADGMLGWIGEDSPEVLAALERSQEMRNSIGQAIARRALVLSTGPEVVHGHIEDTNQPYLLEQLRTAGFDAREGGTVDDDRDRLTYRLREAAAELGYGLIITTGGVGAESKDNTVEAVLDLDPDAHTPHIVRFEQGHGRHTKDGVRIAVGTYGTATIVALPGPHDEVVAALPELIDSLAAMDPIERLALRLAAVLRDVARSKFGLRTDPSEPARP
jgi:molybdenum cofactor synthesis domain-containing protein